METLQPRKRTHHYVWKDYLRPWSHGEKIHSMLRGKLLHEKLEKVAQERDFYELQALSDEDVFFVRTFVIERAMPHLRALHENALRLYLQAHAAVQVGRELAAQHPQVGRSASIIASNLTEDWHAARERDAAPYLTALRAGNGEFYRDGEACREFTLFLATQYFRTRGVKAAVTARMKAISGDADPDRVWTLLAHMFSINVGWSLYAAREVQRLKVIHNRTDLPFITSDQPVINAASKQASDNEAPEHLKFYYPVSPRVAILVGDGGFDVAADPTEADVGTLNQLLANKADLRVFGLNAVDLAPFG